MKTKLFIAIFVAFNLSAFSQNLSIIGESILKSMNKPHVEYDTLRAISIISKNNEFIKSNKKYNPTNDGYPLNEINSEIEICRYYYNSKLSSKKKADIKNNQRLMYFINQLETIKVDFNQYVEKQKARDQFVKDSIIADRNKKEKLQIETEKNQLDSIEKNLQSFFNPTLIAKVVGMPNATKQNLESEYNVVLLDHRGGWDYYDFSKTNVGFKFGGNSNVCYKISFRLFGDEASEYENQLKDDGFKLLSRKESSNLELEGDLSSQLLNGELRVYKMGSVVCQVYDGSYIGFTFYRIK